MEHLLQYVWMHKIFPLKLLRTTEGIPLEIIDTGIHNRDAGPDFFNAKVKLGDTVWVGNVEIHDKSSDWYRHGHDKDRAYDSIILHVVGNPDTEIFRPDGQCIPQFQLICPESVCQHYDELLLADYNPRCRKVLPLLSTFDIHSWMSTLGVERLEQKTNAIRQRVSRCNGSWEDAFFVTLSRNVGFGLNGDAFEQWAYHLPLKAINKYRDDLFQVEAFFFGTAGLLEEAQGDDYFLRLKKEYEYFKHTFQLRKSLNISLWRQFRVRPNNFFEVRIAQLAALYHHSYSLFPRFMDIQMPVDVCSLLDVQTSPYWDTHFSFTHPSPENKKRWGSNAMQLIIINTLVPVLYAYGKHTGKEELCERAFHFLQELKSEQNFIIQQWQNLGVKAESAADSQAIIQLQKEYCEKKKCLHCRFGYEFLKR
jgi:hypothetical protein